MEYNSLKSLGVKHIEDIEKYSLRSELDQDVLKIYHVRKKGELFQRSEKFKFPRRKRMVRSDVNPSEYKEISEVSSVLTHVLAELDDITNHVHDEKSVKEQILSDLRHLEKVVQNKIAEIESKLDRL
ncbi:DUF3461 family protein [Litoribrevibacter albus]|uniref:UPF0325 protein n=1 Tax=Litoribrevibacter albus TaxID=1473156 RepID=A0AA37W7F2_9GAMM|nr:DUF3461 family protein [Litoribrevibacter albus]GLQ32605.1 UPF0325 protein [Litoribrevibacter albus]